MLSFKALKQGFNTNSRDAVTLVLTLVVLVVLSTVAYMLTNQVSAYRHRLQFFIDYQNARYACDSALKYAFANMESVELNLIKRANEPDFSDLFALDQDQYEQYVSKWIVERQNQDIAETDHSREVDDINDVGDINGFGDLNAIAKTIGISQDNDIDDFNDSSRLVVRGPYGPEWPLITEPIELEIGQADVIIEIEDENAKLPLSWGITGDEKTKRESQVALQSFLEWMDYEEPEYIETQLKNVKQIKQFKLDLKEIRTTVTEAEKDEQKVDRRTRPSMRRRRSRRSRRRRPRKRQVKVRPAVAHTSDFARLFHSTLIDTESLARPTIETPDRKESLLKYTGLWGSQRVNINTAPRHILESAFSFGGDAEQIAEEIIQKRRVKPFEDVDELKKTLFGYSDSIEKSKYYITTKSRLFTIKVTASIGTAKSSAVAAVIKDSNSVEKIGVIYD